MPKRVCCFLLALAGLALAQTGDASFDGQTLLIVNMAPRGGEVYVTLNGEKLGLFENNVRQDVSDLLTPGENTFELSWDAPVGRLYEAHLSHAAEAGAFTEVAQIDVKSAELKKANSKTVRFTMFGPEKMPRPGSRDRQTLLNILQIDGEPLAVFINDQFVGEFTGGFDYDLSALVKPGENELRLEGVAVGRAVLSVAYAEENNLFRELVAFDAALDAKGEATSRTLNFTLPDLSSATPDSAGPKPSYGSVDKQTLLSVVTGGDTVSIFINDQKVGDFAGTTDLDVAEYVVPGLNSLRLEWSAKLGNPLVRVLYADTKDEFREVASFRGKRAEAGSETLAFRLPEE